MFLPTVQGNDYYVAIPTPWTSAPKLIRPPCHLGVFACAWNASFNTLTTRLSSIIESTNWLMITFCVGHIPTPIRLPPFAPGSCPPSQDSKNHALKVCHRSIGTQAVDFLKLYYLKRRTNSYCTCICIGELRRNAYTHTLSRTHTHTYASIYKYI